MLRSSAIIMVGIVLSRVLGLAREVIIGALFGTSGEYDAYVAAFRLPDTLFLLVMSGAFGSAFLPIFVGFWARGRTDLAWRLASAVMTLTVVVFVGLALLCALLAPWLVSTFIAPGMTGARLDLTIQLTRLLLAAQLVLGLGAAAMGILNARERFAWPAFAPVAYNLGIIGGAALLHEPLGIYSLPAGVIAGASLHFLIQTPGLWLAGFRYAPSLSLRTPGLTEMGRLLAPRILGQAAAQINVIVLTNIASRLPEGRLSALNYALLLAMLPHGIFAMSLATVIFPKLAAQFGRAELNLLRRTLTTALRLLLFLTTPAAVGLIVLRVPLVQVLLQWRAFTSESTALVSDALGWFSLGLLGVALVEATSRAFYAMHDTLTPVLAGGGAIVINLALSLALVDRLGHNGLALALSAASLTEMTVLLLVLRQRLGPFAGHLARPLLRAAVAAGVMAALLLPVSEPLALVTDPARGRSLGQVLWLASAIGWGTIGYLLANALTGSPELAEAGRLVLRRVPARWRHLIDTPARGPGRS